MIAAGVILFCAIGLIAIVVIISRRKNGVTAAKTTKETEDEQGSSVLLDPTSDQLKKIALETGAMEIRFDLPLEEGTFECVAIMIMTGAETMVRSISVRFLKDPDQNVVGWDTRRHYAGKHLDFAK